MAAVSLSSALLYSLSGRGFSRCSRLAALRSNCFGHVSARRRQRNAEVVAALEDDTSSGSKQGRQLWSKELRGSSDEFDELPDNDEIRVRTTIERDIERLMKKEEVERLLSRQPYNQGKGQAVDPRQSSVREIVDKILVADFFFILFSLGWLVAGLGAQIAFKSSTLIDAWLPLWASVFQPALGVFMAGAIVSAIVKKR